MLLNTESNHMKAPTTSNMAIKSFDNMKSPEMSINQQLRKTSKNQINPSKNNFNGMSNLGQGFNLNNSSDFRYTNKNMLELSNFVNQPFNQGM